MLPTLLSGSSRPAPLRSLRPAAPTMKRLGRAEQVVTTVAVGFGAGLRPGTASDQVLALLASGTRGNSTEVHAAPSVQRLDRAVLPPNAGTAPRQVDGARSRSVTTLGPPDTGVQRILPAFHTVARLTGHRRLRVTLPSSALIMRSGATVSIVHPARAVFEVASAHQIIRNPPVQSTTTITSIAGVSASARVDASAVVAGIQPRRSSAVTAAKQ